MTHEEKDAQRQKENLIKNAKRLVDYLTDDIHLKKIIWNNHARNPAIPAHRRKISRNCMKRRRLCETIEESVKRRKTDCEHKKTTKN